MDQEKTFQKLCDTVLETVCNNPTPKTAKRYSQIMNKICQIYTEKTNVSRKLIEHYKLIGHKLEFVTEQGKA